jgi:hypothetical protein
LEQNYFILTWKKGCNVRQIMGKMKKRWIWESLEGVLKVQMWYPNWCLDKYANYFMFFFFIINYNFFFVCHAHYNPFTCGKGLFKILNFEKYFAYIFKFHIFLIVSVFLMWVIGYYHLIFFTIKIILLK